MPSIVEAVVKKVKDKRITNFKDLRKLRSILPEPVARAHFLSDAGGSQFCNVASGTHREEAKGRIVRRSGGRG
ncbi:hypothetical protein GOA89_28885 [Sinorhizobium meliloti]|nr:hypothetical protein [Sinorhizobium meliloti]MDW9850215.1 hypothetical protein [Sinorhizobium meliloti]MDX0146999.1 hypothetical protein [Sinorhizobium meliloti]MDX0153336.1 hypothetical protein [Sinorhizobium meliloti]MDX0172124.1 hypothetical protein [Sinorhizobium meliloti]